MKLPRIDRASLESSQINLDALYAIAPSCFTEVKGDDGQLTRKVDFDALRELLGGAITDADTETFGFQWVGKQEAKRTAAAPTHNTLRPVMADSVNWDTTENLYIEGDNLEVLKLLQRAYLGKVKMIYIDPPYNTGKDFVYNDDFAMSREEMDKAMGNVDEEGNRLRQNLDSNPRYHSDWCSMIYSRLLVARTLLSNDGVIFISIDDHEVHHLRKICDEVFGAENLVAEIPWQSRSSIQNDTDFSVNHEYILVYAKNRRKENRRLKESNKSIWYNRDSFVCSPIPLNMSKFENPDNDPRGPWKADPFDAPNIRPNLTYPITNPNTGEQHLPPRGRCWRTDCKQYANALKEGRILFGKNGTGRPQLKVFYEEKKDFGSVDNSWFSAERIGTSTQGTKEQIKLFGGIAPFDTPKPLSLIYKLLQLANLRKDSLILDFFSGSATTAHAVMQLNAEDGGNRKYIMVQIPKPTPEGSEARKAGYNTICEIGKERIRRAGNKIKEEVGLMAKKLDTGFRVLRVDSSNFNDVYFEPAKLKQDDLFKQVDNLKADRSELDLLFGCMVSWGVALSHPLRQESVEGKRLHIVNLSQDESSTSCAMVACFDKNISREVIARIAQLNPQRAVFRETCFATDADKLNIYEHLKQLCQWSEDEVYKRIRVL
jgi:DNA (cytosine-5-)-methyltransferase